jgi:hypothetical protein
MPDEAIGVISGFLIASMLLRVTLALAGVERWTVAWSVVNATTIAFVWPVERIGITSQPVLGSLQVADLVAATVAVIAALYLLAARTITRGT